MYIFLVLSLLVIVSTVAIGFKKYFNGTKCKKGQIKKALGFNLSAIIPVVAGLLITIVPKMAYAASAAGVSQGAGIGYIAAGLSTGLASIGAGVAVGSVGSSALGAVSEDPKILGKTLIYVGLAEGIAIYGLIISIMILGKLG